VSMHTTQVQAAMLMENYWIYLKQQPCGGFTTLYLGSNVSIYLLFFKYCFGFMSPYALQTFFKEFGEANPIFFLRSQG
jgi:hypothetical protein